MFSEDVELRFDDNLSYIENTKYATVPLVIHGNGLSKIDLNSFTNYIPHRWTAAEGCVECKEDRLMLPEVKSLFYVDYLYLFVLIFILLIFGKLKCYYH